MEQLNGYGVFSTRQIQKLIFKGINIKTVLRRLRLLKAGGFLLSSEGLPNGGLAWFLTKKGAGLFHPSAHTKPINRNSLQHDVTVSSIRMRLESLNIVESWTPEHILKRKALKTLYSSEKSLSQVEDPPIVPDGLFVIKQKGKWEAVALELETSVKSVKRYRKIFSLYRKKQLLRLLWYVVLNKSFGEALLRLWHKYNDYAVCGFSYSTLEEVFKKGFKLPILGGNRRKRSFKKFMGKVTGSKKTWALELIKKIATNWNFKNH